ncbi:hypothetical protein ACWGDE_14455 [Streptomyces sp. NPDC054956]
MPCPVGDVEGPDDAAYLPRLEMSLRPADAPVTEPVAKFGGAPVWLAEPSWPLHPRTGEPLDFVGQFPVPAEPGEELRLAYLFLAYDDYETGGMDGDTGDAVLLVQPGGRIPHFAVIGPPGTTGRSLWRFTPDEEMEPVEFRIELSQVDPDERYVERELDNGYAFFDNHMGGRPTYPDWALQEAPWRFFFRLEDAAGGGPFFLNFGGGAGFACLSPDRLEGRFDWAGA